MTPQIHGWARNHGAGHRNLNRESCDTLDFGLCDIRPGSKSTGIADQHANDKSLAVLLTDIITLSIFRPEHLLPMINDGDLHIPLAFCTGHAQVVGSRD